MNDVITAELADQPPQPLRLRIWHLMVWMAATGLVVLLSQPSEIEKLATQENIELSKSWYGWFIVQAMMSGITIASLVLFAVERVNRMRRVPTQVGHWFLISGGLGTIVYFSAHRLFSNCVEIHPDWLYYSGCNAAALSAFFIVSMGMTVVILFHIREPLWFLILLIGLPLDFVHFIVSMTLMVMAIQRDEYGGYNAFWQDISLKIIAALWYGVGYSVAVVWDLTHGVQRDWLHHLAIVLAIASFLSELVVNWQSS